MLWTNFGKWRMLVQECSMITRGAQTILNEISSTPQAMVKRRTYPEYFISIAK